MRFYILIFLLTPFFAFSQIHPGIMDSAKKICSNENECTTIIALELDGSYHDGSVFRNNKVPLELALKDKEDKLSNLCVNAPDQNLCYYYKHELMKEFYLGFKG